MTDKPQELMYVMVDGIIFEIKTSSYDYFYELQLKGLQIDNQLDHSTSSVVLHCNLANHPAVHLSLVEVIQSSPLVDRYRYVGCLMSEMNLRVNEEFVSQSLAFFNQYVEDLSKQVSIAKDKDMISHLWKEAVVPPEKSQDFRYLYVDTLLLNPIKINLSFTPSLVPDPDSPFRKLVGAMGVGVLNIDHAPIQLNSLYSQSLYITRMDFTDRVTRHYLQQGLRQFYKIIGSADAIGNPVSLVSNLGTGVKDFFYEPAHGLVKSPMDFGKGVAKGSSSLVKHSVYGISATVSKLSETVSKGVATLSLDHEYLQVLFFFTIFSLLNFNFDNFEFTGSRRSKSTTTKTCW